MSEADRADRVAMVSGGERKKPGTAALPCAAGVFVSHFQRRFHGRRTVIGKKDAPQSLAGRLSGQMDQLRAKEGSRLIGQPQSGRVGDFFKLPRDRGIDGWMTVAMQIGPNGGIRIQIFPALGIDQGRALPAGNDNRFAPQPIAHLRERMPQILLIQPRERS